VYNAVNYGDYMEFKVGDRVKHLNRRPKTEFGTVVSIKSDELKIKWDSNHESNIYTLDGRVTKNLGIAISKVTPLEELL